MVGCASKGPAPASTATGQANPVSQEAASPELKAAFKDASKKAPLGNYKLTMKNGVEYYCTRETPTGSKLKSRNICITREEAEAAAIEGERQTRAMQEAGSRVPASAGPYQ
jgi:hypothetical protein